MNKMLIYFFLRNSVADSGTIKCDGGKFTFGTHRGIPSSLDELVELPYAIKPFSNLVEEPSLEQGDPWQEVSSLIGDETLVKVREIINNGRTDKQEILKVIWPDLEKKLIEIMPDCQSSGSEVVQCEHIKNENTCDEKEGCRWNRVVGVVVLTESLIKETYPGLLGNASTLINNNIVYRSTEVGKRMKKTFKGVGGLLLPRNSKWLMVDNFKKPKMCEIMDREAPTPTNDSTSSSTATEGFNLFHIDSAIGGSTQFLRDIYGAEMEGGFAGHMFNVWASLQNTPITSAPLGIVDFTKKEVIYGAGVGRRAGIVFRTSTQMHGSLNFIQGKEINILLRCIRKKEKDCELRENNTRQSMDIRFLVLHEKNPRGDDYNAQLRRLIPDVPIITTEGNVLVSEHTHK